MNENQNEQTQAEQAQDTIQDVQLHAAHAPAVVSDTDQYAITQSNSSPVYCTVDDTTMDGKRKLYHYDIYIDVNARVQKDGENAGVIENKPRTILIDDKGESYIAGVSIGIYQAVKEIIRTFGDPKTWLEPLPVVVVQVNTPKGKMLSLDIV